MRLGWFATALFLLLSSPAFAWPASAWTLSARVGAPVPVPVNIASLNLSNASFTTGTAGTVGTLSATVSSGSPTGSFSLTNSGTDHSGTTCNNYSADFSVSGTSLNFGSGAPAQSYPGTCITYTQAGATNSPYTQAFTVTGSAPGTLIEVGSGYTLVNNGSTTSNVPVRFGYGFARGDMPLGNTVVCKDESGNTYPCQIDQLSTRTGMPHSTDTAGWLHSTISLLYTPSWTASATHTFHIYKQSGTYSPGTGICPNTGGCSALTSVHDYQILYQNVKLFNGTALGNFTCDLNKAIAAGPIAGIGAGVDSGGGGYQVIENGSVVTTIEALTPCENGSTPQGQIMAKFFVMLWNSNPGGTPVLGQVELVGWIGQPWQNCTTGVCAGGAYSGGIGFNWGDVTLYDATTTTTLRSYSHSSAFAPSDVLINPTTQWPASNPDGHTGTLYGQFAGACGGTFALCPGGGYGTTLNVSGSTVTQSGGSGLNWNFYGSIWNNAYLYVGSGNTNCTQGKYPVTSAMSSGSFTINATGLGGSCSAITNWQIASGFINNYDNIQSGLGITFSVTNGTLPTPLQAGQLYFAGTGINVLQNDSSTSHNALSPFSVWGVPTPAEWGEHVNDHWRDQIGLADQGICNSGGSCLTVTRHAYLEPWTGMWLMSDDNSHPFYIAASNPANTAVLYPNLSTAQKTYWESTALIPPYYFTASTLTAPSPTPISYFNNNTNNNGGPYYEGEAVGPQETAITAGGNHVGLGNMSGFAANWFLNSTQANWDLVNNDALSASTVWDGALLNSETGWVTTYDCGTYPSCGAYTYLTKNAVSPSAHQNDYNLWSLYGNPQSSGFTAPTEVGIPTLNSTQSQQNFLGGVYFDAANTSDVVPTHYPDFSDPMAYIISGNPWMLRQTQWWANTVIAGNSSRNATINSINYTGQVAFGGEEQRSDAWPLRSVMWSAVLGADNDPQRAYFWNLEIENMDGIYAKIHQYYGQNINSVPGGSPDTNYEPLGQWLTHATLGGDGQYFDDQFMHSYLANVLQENYALTHYTSGTLSGASSLYAAQQSQQLLIEYWALSQSSPDSAGHTLGLYWMGAEGFSTVQSINGSQATPGENPTCPNAGCIGIADGATGYAPDAGTQQSGNYFYYAGNNYSSGSQGLIENGDMMWASFVNDSGNALNVLGNTRYFVINVTPEGSNPPIFQLTTTPPSTQACTNPTGTAGCPSPFIPSSYGSNTFSLAWRPQAKPSSGLGGFGGGATGYAASTYAGFQQSVNDGVLVTNATTALNNNQARNPLSSYFLSQNAVDGAQWQSWYMGSVTVP